MSYVQEMSVYEGKTFQIDLQSMAGSTGYGWALSKLPEGLILLGSDTIPQRPGIAPVIQRFYLAVISAANPRARVEFVLVRSFDVVNEVDTCAVELLIVSSNMNQFVPYSDNAAVKYGYPCAAQDAALKYGYPCAAQDAALKYGYPCTAQDAALKYGYPCAAQDAALKYGYPCAEQDAALKYGYPCAAQDAALKYGYPYTVQNNSYNNIMPYGYIDAGLEKYGFPCVAQDARAYGFAGNSAANQDISPFPANISVKYGYPTCI